MAVITGYYANWPRSIKRPIQGQGTEVLLMATSDRLPSHPTKDGRATDSCFALVGAHQCGVLMVEGRMTGCFYVHPSEALMVSAEAVEAISQSVTVHSRDERWGIVIYTVAQY